MLDKLYENAVEIAKGGKIGISLMSYSNSGFREWSTKNGSEKLLMTQKCKSCNDVTWHQSLKRDMLEITKNNDSIESNTNLVNLEFPSKIDLLTYTEATEILRIISRVDHKKRRNQNII